MLTVIVILIGMLVGSSACLYVVLKKQYIAKKEKALHAVKKQDEYANLHAPCYDIAGDLTADIYADSATWERTTGTIRYHNPLVYQYRYGKCVRVIKGDVGQSDVVAGRVNNVNVRGHVHVKEYSNGTRAGNNRPGK